VQKSKLLLFLIFFLGIFFGLLTNFSIPLILALLVATLAAYTYTMRDASGLKHNQAKYFIVISALLYFVSLAISLYSTVILIILALYEIFNGKNLKVLSLSLLPYIIITIISLFAFI
jgi:hypothetical protein